MKVFVKLAPNALLPEYKSEQAAGADLHAYLKAPVLLRPMDRLLVPTGVCVQLPKGYEMQVRPRSGLALNFGITVLNAPGTVDSDYRGELKVLLINLGTEDFIIKNGDRIAQAVVSQVCQAEFENVPFLSKTERGDAGYGSTGL